MTVCAFCGHEGNPRDRYCQACGRELPEAQDDMAEARNLASRQASSYAHSSPSPANGSAAAPSLRRTGAPAAVVTSVAQARVIVRSASDNESGDRRDEREFSLDGRDLAVGRAPSCDIVLSGDQLASRRHALLRNKGRHYTVVDLGSSNGTYVNDLEIREETVLHDGDCIKIGGHELMYATGAAGPNASLPGVGPASRAPQSPLLETMPSMASISMGGVMPGEGPLASASGIQHGEQAFIVAQAAGASQSGPHEPSEPLAGLSAMPAPVTPDSHVPQRAGPTGGLDMLRAQLAELSAALAEQADAEAQAIQRLHSTLTDARERLDDLLLAYEKSPSDVRDLVAIARQAAENPRHLDYVAMLADHAGAIADALEERLPVVEREDTWAKLHDLRERLDALHDAFLA